MVMYDLTDEASFVRVRDWMRQLAQHNTVCIKARKGFRIGCSGCSNSIVHDL